MAKTAKQSSDMVRIDAQIPTQLKERLEYAASIQGRTQTDFMISVLTEATDRVIADETVIRLSPADQMKLAEALLSDEPYPPVESMERLRRAIRESNANVKSE